MSRASKFVLWLLLVLIELRSWKILLINHRTCIIYFIFLNTLFCGLVSFLDFEFSLFSLAKNKCVNYPNKDHLYRHCISYLSWSYNKTPWKIQLEKNKGWFGLLVCFAVLFCFAYSSRVLEESMVAELEVSGHIIFTVRKQRKILCSSHLILLNYGQQRPYPTARCHPQLRWIFSP